MSKSMSKKKLLGVSLESMSMANVLEKTLEFTQHPQEFLHIASLNPEIMILAQSNPAFKDYLNWAQIRIIDGVGVLAASKLRGYDVPERVTGVDLLEKLLKMAGEAGLRVALIGGKGKVAERLADRQNRAYPGTKCVGTQGISNIHNPDQNEEKEVLSIVADLKPHMIFVAFGSPYQELWLNKHKERFKGIICMGVGGSFDFLSGKVERAPLLFRNLGLEWLFRLGKQPWRLKRQLKIPVFFALVIREMYER